MAKDIRDTWGVCGVINRKKHSGDHEGTLKRGPEDKTLDRIETGTSSLKGFCEETPMANQDFLSQGYRGEKKA
jgi:hypothetical protein